MSLKSLSQINLGQYTLPTSDGSNGQVLQTNGSGTVTFATNKFLSGLSFNTSTGVLTATVSGGSDITVDLDNRYLELTGGTLTGNLQIDTAAVTSVGTGIVLNRPAAGTHYHGLHFSTNGTCNWAVGQNSNDSFQIYEEGLNAKTRFTIAQGGDTTIAGRTDLQKDLRLRGNDSSGNIGVVRFFTDANDQLIIDTGNDGSNRTIIDGSGNATFAGDVKALRFDMNPNYADSNEYLLVHKRQNKDGGIILRSKPTGGSGQNDWQIVNHASTGDLRFYAYGLAGFALTLDREDGNATFGADITTTGAIAGQTLTLSGSTGSIIQYVRSSGSVSYIQIQNSATQYGGSSNGLTVGNNGTAAYIWNREQASLYLGTNDTTALHLDNSQRAIFAQNVSVPQTKKILFDGINGHTYLAEESDSNLKVYVGGTERFNFAGGTNYSQQTLQGNSSIVQNHASASRTITLSAGSDIRGNNHLLVQGDNSYLKLAAPNNSIYYDGGTHFFRNGAGSTNYVTLSSTDTTIAQDTTIGALTSGQTATLTVNHEGGVPSVARFKSRTNKAHIEISDNDTTGYISSENGFFSIGRNAGVNAAHININASNQVLIGATSTAFNDKLYITGDAYITGGWRVGTSATFVGKLVNDSGKLSLMSDGNRDVQIGSNNVPNILEIDTSAEDSTFSGHLAITGSTLHSYHQFQSDPVSSSDGNNLFSIGGHGMAAGYSRNISIWSTTQGSPWRSWIGTNLRWDGTNYKRATNAANNNWGNVAGIEFKGGSNSTDKTITFYVDEPENASGGTTDSTVGTAIPSAWTAFQIDNNRRLYGYGNMYLGGFSYFGSAFYSQSNSSFYLDPDGTSVLNTATFSGTITTTSTATGAITLNGGTGVATTGAFVLRQNGDGAGNGIAITSSHGTSHRIWKDASGNLNIGPSGDPDAFQQDTSGNATFAGNVQTNKLQLSSDTEHFVSFRTTSLINTGTTVDTTAISGRRIDLYAYDDIKLRAGTSDSIFLMSGGSDTLTLDNSNNATFAGNISNSSGDFTVSSADNFVVDAAGDITLDAAGNDIRFFKNGVEYGKFKSDSSDFAIYSSVENKDMIFRGNDGGTTIDALTLDMSDAGKASFSGAIHGKDSGIIIDSISGPYGRIHGTSSIFLGGSSTSNVQLSAALIPDADSARSLGNSGRYWSNAYIDQITTTGDVNVGGNLNVTGDINSVSVTDLDVTDKTITVGKGQNAANSGSSGLVVERSDSTNPSMLWNQTTSRFDFNSGLHITGQVHTTGAVHAKGSLFVIDTDGTNNHIQARSNGTEGYLTVSNGSNWGFIVRGVVNDPRIGAWYGGTLKIEGFHSSDGATGANAIDFAQFQFGNNHFLVNAASNRFAGFVGIKTPSSYTANTNADDLIVGSGVGNQGITIYSGDSNHGSIYFADDLDEEGAGDNPVGSRDAIIRYEHNNNKFNFRSAGNQNTLTLSRTSADFEGFVSVPTGKSFRLYNAAGTGWGELTLEETENKIQFNRGIKPSGTVQSDQTLGTSTKRWHTLFTGTGNFSSHVKTPYIISNAANQNLFLYANGSGHIYFGDSGNGNNLYHYSTGNDGKYTTYDWNNNYYRIGTTATNGIWLADDLKTNNITATSFIKSGGTSSQFLMADGSVSTGGGSADNLGNHTATQALDMDGNNITDAATVTGVQFLAAQSGYADGYKFSRSGHDSYRLTLANSQGLRILNETDSRTEVQFVGDGSVNFYGNVRATMFSDQDNTAYWLNPAGAHAANLAGRVDITTASDVKMRFKTPSTDSTDWGYVEFYKRDGNRSSYFGINGSGNPVWAVNDGSPYIQLIDSGDYVEVGATNLRASSFVDKDSTAYYGDFGNTGTSVNVAGSINLLDNKMLLWGGNSIVKHTGSSTQIGDNSSGSVLTLASGDADFTGNVEMQSGNSVGKFAVMANAPHGSYDFYNNGTSYFNGAVTIDATCLFSDNEQLRFGASNDFLIYHNSTTNVNHVSSQLDRQLSINANIIQLTNQANSSTYLKLESSKATLNTGLNIGGSVGQRIYAKNYGSLDTTGQAVAGLLSAGNGSSASFVFETAGGGSGGYQRVVFSCVNNSGTWSVSEDINEGGDRFDITSSGNGSTVTFTFKARSTTQYYSPKVNIKAFGHNINETYF